MSIQRLIERQLMRLVPVNGCYGVYGDFAQASAAAPSADTLGYDAANTGSWYRERLTHVTHDDYPLLFWFEKAASDGRRVVEIGGHVGVAFYGFSKHVPLPDDLTWTIVDVPSVTRAGAELAHERKETRLRFVNELPSPATPIDILIASGSLQYVPGPLLPERVRAMRAERRAPTTSPT